MLNKNVKTLIEVSTSLNGKNVLKMMIMFEYCKVSAIFFPDLIDK